MPGLYRRGDYDLAGFAVGAVERARLLPRADVGPGDVLLGLASSGRARQRLLAGPPGDARPAGCSSPIPRPFAPDADAGRGAAGADPDLRAAACSALFEHDVVKALAHITGGGLAGNLPRVLPEGVVARIDAARWHAPPVFLWLYETARMTADEMLRTFNCGIGMVLVVVADYADDVDALPQREGRDRLSAGRADRRRRSGRGCRSTAWRAEPLDRRAGAASRS